MIIIATLFFQGAEHGLPVHHRNGQEEDQYNEHKGKETTLNVR